jgi:Zn finger protein HypA/HybF involved in hydrogenase expression
VKLKLETKKIRINKMNLSVKLVIRNSLRNICKLTKKLINQVECKICHKNLTVLSFKRHMKIQDLKTQPNQFKCEKCEKTFLTKNSQNQHLKTHEKPFECDKCGREFAKKLDLRNIYWYI